MGKYNYYISEQTSTLYKLDLLTGSIFASGSFIKDDQTQEEITPDKIELLNKRQKNIYDSENKKHEFYLENCIYVLVDSR